MTDADKAAFADRIRDKVGVIEDAIVEWRAENQDSVDTIHTVEDMMDQILAMVDTMASPMHTDEEEMPTRTITQITAAHGPQFDQLYLYALASDGSLWVKGSGTDHRWGRIPF